MDNEHYRAAKRTIRSKEDIDPEVFAAISALLAVADALDSIDDALRNTVGGVPRG